MILQQRDREVVNLCYEHQFITQASAGRHLFGGSKRATSRRFKILEAAQYLRTETGSVSRTNKLYRLTRTGRALAEEGRAILIPQTKELARSTMAHDNLVLEARLRLRTFWNAQWLPEGILKSDEFVQIPDGVLLFPSGKKIAIEVENTAKSKDRYQKLWRQWRPGQVALVLYVATSTPLFNLLKRYFQEAPKEMPWSLVEWSRLRTEKPLILTGKGEYDLLARKEF